MKRSLLVFLTMVLFALAGPIGCKKSAAKLAEEAKGNLVGSWLLDSEATLAGMSDEERQAAEFFVNMMRLGMVFGEDDTLEMRVAVMGQSESQVGSFRVVSADAEHVRLEVTRSEEGVETPEVSTMVARFNGDDQITMIPVTDEDPEGTSTAEAIVLRRMSAEDFAAAMDAPAPTPDLGQMLGLPPGTDLEALVGDDAPAADGEEAPAADGAEAPAADGAEAPAEAAE